MYVHSKNGCHAPGGWVWDELSLSVLAGIASPKDTRLDEGKACTGSLHGSPPSVMGCINLRIK